MEAKRPKRVKMWLSYHGGLFHLAFYRDIFRGVPENTCIMTQKDIEDVSASVGRDLITLIVGILPAGSYISLSVNAKRAFSFAWKGLLTWQRSMAERKILDCVRKIFRYEMPVELAVTKRLELKHAFPRGQRVVNLEYSNGAFFIGIAGKKFFHPALPKHRSLRVEDTTGIIDDEQKLIIRLINIAGQDSEDSEVQVNDDCRNIYMDLGVKFDHVDSKRRQIIKTLQEVFGNKMEQLPPAKAGAYKRAEKFCFSF